jgi:hypothetical protein
MARFTISFLLAAALTCAGIAVVYVAFIEHSFAKLGIGAIAIGLGVVWFWAIIDEWRTK